MRQLLTASAIAAVISTTMLGQTEKVYSPGDGVSLPVVVKRVNPDYTSEAMQQQIEGIVTLTSVVRQDGHVTDVKVKQSLDSVYGLDQKAVEALRQWEFKPGTKDNEPVAVQIDVQMKFTLK
jgi:TonB family protein